MRPNLKPAERLRVLLVDDSPERRASVQQSLAEVGCEVVGFAASSDHLLRRVQQLNPEVVIVDLEAPGRDTLESLHSVQSTAPRPVVMFTQDDDGETISRATRAQLEGRKVVDRAKGILMQRRGLSEDQAYKALRNLAVRNNKRLVDVAEGIVAASELLI